MKTEFRSQESEATKPRPNLALSVRQPWAWLLVHGWKPVENRTWWSWFQGPLWIHAGITMTRAEYGACLLFIRGFEDQAEAAKILTAMPSFEELKQLCGGIVGEVVMTGSVHEHSSPWFCGPIGYVMTEAQPVAFRPCKGRLGFFNPEYQPKGKTKL